MPYGSLFSHLKQLLDDFTGAHVEMVAELMQVAGRYLYRLPETHTRADNMSTVCPLVCNAGACALMCIDFASLLHHV